MEYTYDDLDRLIGTSHNGTASVENIYNKRGQLARVMDLLTGKRSEYLYDEAGRVVQYRIGAPDGLSWDLKEKLRYEDKTNRLLSVTQEFGDQSDNRPNRNNLPVWGIKILPQWTHRIHCGNGFGCGGQI